MQPTVLGTSDDVTQCQQCGKKGLRMTVALDFGGEVRYLGRDCAGAALFGGKKSATKTLQAETIARDLTTIRRGYKVGAGWNDITGTDRQLSYCYRVLNGTLEVQLDRWTPLMPWGEL